MNVLIVEQNSSKFSDIYPQCGWEKKPIEPDTSKENDKEDASIVIQAD